MIKFPCEISFIYYFLIHLLSHRQHYFIYIKRTAYFPFFNISLLIYIYINKKEACLCQNLKFMQNPYSFQFW